MRLETFEQWKQRVNLKFIETFGTDSDAFPDWDWHEEFTNGYSPVDSFDYWMRTEGPQ